MWKDILKDLGSENNTHLIDFVLKVVIPKVKEVHPNEVMVRFDKSNDRRPNVVVAPLGTPEEFIRLINKINKRNKYTTVYEPKRTSNDTVWIKIQ